MSGHNNENLANLVEPVVDDIVHELEERFNRGLFYVNFGDGVIAINPQSNEEREENFPENGRKYCSKKPIPNLPPHVYALVHNVYRDATLVTSLPEAHCIFVAGASGSGKTEVSEMMLAQFLRESGVSYKSDIPFILMKGLFLLKRLLTCKSISGPTSSAASMLLSLYFDDCGKFKTARISTHLLNSRHSTLHTEEKWYLNIFYDLVAALRTDAIGLTTRGNSQRIFENLDSSLTHLSHETFLEHRNMWLDIVDVIKVLDIGNNKSSDIQNSANSFLDSLLALLLIATIQFDMDPHTNQIKIMNAYNFSTAAQLLGVSDQALYSMIMTEALKLDGLPLEDAVQSRDQLVHELYSRMVRWLIEQINSKLPDVESESIVVHIADLPTFEDCPAGRLETLCHNMAAEYVQLCQNKAIFCREIDACKAENLKVSALKQQRCEQIVDLAFTTPNGLLHQLEILCNNAALSDEKLVKALDKNFKKNIDLYTGSKILGSGTFAITHSHKQVMYNVDALFRKQNLIIPNRAAQQLFLSSRNGTIQKMFESVSKELSNPDPQLKYSYITYMKVQVKALMDTLQGTVPHFVRCIKPSPVSPIFDADFVRLQIQSASFPDIIHHKKFSYSHWMTIPDFLRRYRLLGYSMTASLLQPEEICKTVLKKVGILEKGSLVTKRMVFLSYWHKEKLDTLVAEHIWKITLVQACVRGHLTRKRFHEVVATRMRFRDEATSLRRRNSFGRSSDQIPYDENAESELFEKMITKTLERITELPSSVTWAKVIYLEQGKELAKAYAAELSLFVSGSSNDFDGLELGLSYFCAPNRLVENEYIVANFGQGIELRRDSDGSILAKRLCQLPVFVKQHQHQPVMSADMLRTRGELPHGHFVKIFDMQEFYSLISLEMKRKSFSKSRLRKACVTVVRFGGSDLRILRMPCWVAVININALNILDNEKELQAISLMTSQLTLSKGKSDDESKEKQIGAKTRRQKKQWSRTDQRPQLNKREINSRKLREELRDRGENISDHMGYSWKEEVVHKFTINMDQLYERLRNQNVSVPSSASSDIGNSSPVRNWAKLNVALRQATRDLQKAEMKETNAKDQERL